MRTPKILIVKMSSMGDLVHAIPAVNELAMHFPHAQIDWVAEEAFTAVPQLTSVVSQVIPIALRRWRKHWFDPKVKAERCQFKARLTQTRYDAVIDLQGLLKSAMVAKMAQGPRHGLDWSSAKEPLASLFYNTKSHVDWSRTMVDRSRQLVADAMGYKPDGVAQFNPNLSAFTFPQELSLQTPYAAIMPASSVALKLWPEAYWQQILQRIIAQGVTPYLFSGSDTELERAQRLALSAPGTIALPKLSLDKVIAVLSHARLVVGLDSGLTHIGAALGRPTVGIYAPTTSACVPLMGDGFVRDIGGAGKSAPLELVDAAVRDALEYVS